MTTNEPIARRQTADGKTVLLFANGGVTGGFGVRLAPGVPTRGRSPRAIRAGWLFVGEVELFDADETPALWAAAAYVADRSGLPGDVRADAAARLAANAAPTVAPFWVVTETDRDGAPRERVWRCPRARWPGLAVFDFCRRRPRYEVFRVDAADVCTPTGFRAADLPALRRALDTAAARLAE